MILILPHVSLSKDIALMPITNLPFAALDFLSNRGMTDPCFRGRILVCEPALRRLELFERFTRFADDRNYVQCLEISCLITSCHGSGSVNSVRVHYRGVREIRRATQDGRQSGGSASTPPLLDHPPDCAVSINRYLFFLVRYAFILFIKPTLARLSIRQGNHL